MLGERIETREYVRLPLSFQVHLHKVGVHVSFEGITGNISQGGAYIRTKEWREFDSRDQTLLTFCLPPDFTGQNEAIRLLGTAVVKRIDKENEGLGVQFNKRLRQFERIH